MATFCSEQKHLLSTLEADPTNQLMLNLFEQHTIDCSICEDCETQLKSLLHSSSHIGVPLPASLEELLQLCLESRAIS